MALQEPFDQHEAFIRRPESSLPQPGPMLGGLDQAPTVQHPADTFKMHTDRLSNAFTEVCRAREYMQESERQAEKARIQHTKAEAILTQAFEDVSKFLNSPAKGNRA